MRKAFSFSLLILLLFAVLQIPITVDAKTGNRNEDVTIVSRETTYNDDGSYFVITLSDENTNQPSGYGTNSTYYYKNGSMDVTWYNKSGSIAWQYTLYGHFQVYPGVAAYSYFARYDYVINTTGWHFIEGSAKYAEGGNTVFGTATLKDKILFIVFSTVYIDINFSCDANGEFYVEGEN